MLPTMRRFVVCLLFFVGATPALAQPGPGAFVEVGQPLLKTYAPNTYKAGSQNWAIAQDAQGRMYFGNDQGLLVYDGVTWAFVSTPSNEVVRSLALGEEGNLYAGTFGDFGYFHPDQKGRLHFTSLQPHIPPEVRDFVDVWKTHVTPAGIYFQTESYLFRWNGEALAVWHPAETFGFSWTSFIVRGRLYIQDMDRGLLTMDADSLRPVPGTEPIAGYRTTVMLPYGEDQMLIGTEEAGLFIYDGATLVPFAPAISAFLSTHRLFSGVALPDGTYGFNTLGGGFVQCDRAGHLLQRIDKSTGLKDQTIFEAYLDRQQGLWLASGNGIARVELDTPLTFLDDGNGLNGSITLIKRHAGTLYVGTALGLFVLKPARTALAPPVLEAVEGLRNLGVWTLTEAQGMLLAATDAGVYKIQGTRADLIDDSWALSMIRARHDDRLLFVGLANGLLRLRYQPERRTWAPAGHIADLSTSLFNIVEGAQQTLWLGLASGGVIRLAFGQDYRDEPVQTPFGAADGLPEGQVTVTRVGEVLRFQTGEGLYRYDPAQSPPFFADTTLRTASGRRINALLAEDRTGALWAMHNEGLGYLQPAAGADTYTWAKEGLSRRLAAWSPTTTYVDEETGIVWFGSSERLFRYDPNREDTAVSADPVLLGQVTFGDSLLFGGIQPTGYKAPVMDYGNHTLRFRYATPSYDAPEHTRYQVFLDGFDQDWSAPTAETQKDYTNLSEGAYHFRVRARDVYGRAHETEPFPFRILPPWYRTAWAYAFYGIAGMGLLFGGARGWNWRLEQKNRQLEAVIAERTQELHQKNVENERLLLNILPESIANRLKLSDEPIADAFPDVTVLFSDLVGFTVLSQQISAAELVALLNDLFSEFDALALQHQVEKIKTIGDAYMAVCGLPEERPDHAQTMARMALDMLTATEKFNRIHGTTLRLRIGLNTGPVVAGVIGTHKFIYDLWGDTVNTAARMESHGIPGHVHLSEATFAKLQGHFGATARGPLAVKGKGTMHTYLLDHPAPPSTPVQQS